MFLKMKQISQESTCVKGPFYRKVAGLQASVVAKRLSKFFDRVPNTPMIMLEKRKTEAATGGVP